MYADSKNIWQNPHAHLVRSATRELELKQKKKQQHPLTNHNVNTANKKPIAPELTSQNTKRTDFINYSFYLDSIEPSTQKRLANHIKLLGAKVEAFFSNKCTHVITSKSSSNDKLMDQENIPPTALVTSTTYYYSTTPTADSINNKTNSMNKKKIQLAADPIKDDIVDKARKWNIKVWKLDYAIPFIRSLLESSQRNKRKLDEKKALGKIYQDDKAYGPSTSNSNDHQSAKPRYVEFTGHYCIVGDVTNVHRAPVIKEYSRKLIDKNHGDFPWPYLKNNSGNKSPFSYQLRERPAVTTQPKEIQAQQDGAKQEGVNNKIQQNDQQVTVENKIGKVLQPLTTTKVQTVTPLVDASPPAASVPHPTTTTTTTTTHFNILPLGAELSLPTTPHRTGDDSQLHASGFHPSASNTQSTISRCVSGLTSVDSQSKILHAESICKLDKRVIENISRKDTNLSITSQSQQKQQGDPKLDLRRRQHQQHQQHQLQQQQQKHDKELETNMCENCNKRFNSLEEHIKSESHQAFIRDQNNFKELDMILEMTKRQYKTALPDYMRGQHNPNIDGKNIRWQSSSESYKRNLLLDMTDIQPPRSHKMLKCTTDTDGTSPAATIRIENLINPPENWEKFNHVFR